LRMNLRRPAASALAGPRPLWLHFEKAASAGTCALILGVPDGERGLEKPHPVRLRLQPVAAGNTVRRDSPLDFIQNLVHSALERSVQITHVDLFNLPVNHTRTRFDLPAPRRADRSDNPLRREGLSRRRNPPLRSGGRKWTVLVSLTLCPRKAPFPRFGMIAQCCPVVKVPCGGRFRRTEES